MPFVNEEDPKITYYTPPGSTIPISTPPVPPAGQTWVPGTQGTPGAEGTPGNTPDYIALYHQSPEYIQWLASANGQNISYGQARAAIIRELIRQYGDVPQAWKDQFGDVRAEDVAAAQGNQFSQTAMIQRNYQMGVEQMRRALAARGMLQSGELDYGQGQADFQRGQQESDAFGQFMKGVTGAVTDWTSNTNQVAASETPVITNTLGTLRGLYPATAGTPGTPGVDPVPGHWAPTPPLKIANPATPIPRPSVVAPVTTKKKPITRQPA